MAVPKARTVIRERYRLESMIGEGGMASVWRARDLTLARAVAVKLLFARDDRDRSALTSRFLREARIAASVQHRNVIQIVDFGTTEDELPFMVMELLEGEPLSGRVHRERRLPLQDVVQIANLTLRGLAAVHAAGIIHRDLKPDNIYLKRENESVYPKILDFGISRSVEPTSGRRSALTTREGLIIGTPEYMSPEQARGIKNIDPRTDLYSMGVILYEALTGRLPFHSENVGDLIIQVVTGTAPTVHEVNPSVPLAISQVIEKAMARKREDRYAGAVEMQAALLEAAAQGDPRSAARMLSEIPRFDDGSGSRRLTPEEIVALATEDALPAPRLTREQSSLPAQPVRPTTDGFAVVPPVTQTLKTTVLDRNTLRSQARRWALPLAAAAAVIYSTLVLLHARDHEDLSPTPARAAVPSSEPIEIGDAPARAAVAVPPAPVAEPEARTDPSEAAQAPQRPVGAPAPTKSAAPAARAPARTQVVGGEDQVVEVVVGHELAKPRPAEATRRKARARPATRTRKPQGALRTLDF